MQCCRQAVFLFVTALTVSAVVAVSASVDPINEPEQNVRGGVDKNHSQVIIIGGGSAGVAAAARLMENGVVDVTILEAENRLGGRVHSVPFGETVVDLGAQWVHGVVGNVVYEMAAPLGLLQENATNMMEYLQYLQGNGEVPDHEELDRLFNISDTIRTDKVSMAGHNGSFGQYFWNKFSEYAAGSQKNFSTDRNLVLKFVNWFEKAVGFSDGADSWFNLSTQGSLAYWECPGDQSVNWKNNGYYSVINLLTKRYPHPNKELPVRQNTRFNTEVKKISWGQNGVVGPTGRKAVLVEDSNGARYTADVVLVTVSLGVLKERATTMFNPPLPSRKMNAIRNIGFGQVDKIFMNFNETWWPAIITGFSILATDADRERFYRQYPMYRDKGEWLHGLSGLYLLPRQPQTLLMDWLVGEPARNMEKYTDHEVMAGCMRWLELFYNRSLAPPVSLIRSKWWSSPHFRGSYSHRSLDSETFDALPAQLAEPLFGPDGTPEVLFAGEATNDHHFSTVHGAVETGWREADRILNLLRSV